MVTADLGACEWFVWDLRRSNLIERGQLDQIVGEFLKKNPRAEPPSLADYLVNQGVVSRFQADRILQGKTQGLVLGPYSLIDAIGSGSMGTVYKAHNKTDQQMYAVKVLPRRSMWNVRLARRQVRSFGQFQHPAVVPFVDVGTSGGMHYLAWPLVEGESLDRVVQDLGKLAPDVAALVVLQVSEGLAICHKNGLFHGLIKPSNLMVGADRQLRILDFGIGSLLAENEGESLVDTMSTANTLTSGLDCASPESIMDPTKRTPAGDQYSLGCVLYYCLTGQFPFPEGTAVEKMMSHQMKQPKPIAELAAGVPAGLVAVVDRLMQKAPEARYASCEELVDALQAFAAPPSAVPRIQPRASAVENGRSGAAPPVSSPARGTTPQLRLPTRETIRGGHPEPTPPPGPPPSLMPPSGIPGGLVGDSGRSWDERLGPAGTALIILVILGMVALAFWFLGSPGN